MGPSECIDSATDISVPLSFYLVSVQINVSLSLRQIKPWSSLFDVDQWHRENKRTITLSQNDTYTHVLDKLPVSFRLVNACTIDIVCKMNNCKIYISPLSIWVVKCGVIRTHTHTHTKVTKGMVKLVNQRPANCSMNQWCPMIERIVRHHRHLLEHVVIDTLKG